MNAQHGRLSTRLADDAAAPLTGASARRVGADLPDLISAEGLQQAVRRHPMEAMAVAAGLGIGLALLVSTQLPKSRSSQRGYLPDGLSSLDVNQLSSTVRDAVHQSLPREMPVARDVMPTLSDRLVNALEDTRARQTLTDLTEKTLAWWKQLAR